jgi:hypothetical protein
MQAVYLVCDGCAAECGPDGRFRSAIEARAGAYADGWRFPAALTARGAQGSRTHDVCPACVPDWRPREYEGVSKQYRRPESPAG